MKGLTVSRGDHKAHAFVQGSLTASAWKSEREACRTALSLRVTILLLSRAAQTCDVALSGSERRGIPTPLGTVRLLVGPGPLASPPYKPPPPGAAGLLRPGAEPSGSVATVRCGGDAA